MDKSDLVKLNTLLNYWIEHNKEHSQEFKEWGDKVSASGETEASEYMLQAAQEMDKAGGFLLQTLQKLEGRGQ